MSHSRDDCRKKELKLQKQSDLRTRQYPHSYSYRLMQTTKDSYKYSFFSRTIAQWNLLPVAAVQ
jgi:hypothetical protein